MPAPAVPPRAHEALPDYDGVVFAGGGCRCFWEAGFWFVASTALDLRPRTIGAVSAGVAMACAASLGVLEAVLDTMKRRTAHNPSNLHLGRWWRGQPLFPHEAIYRQTILDHLGRGDELDRLRAGPDIRALLSRAPRWLGADPSLAAAVVAYHLDKLGRGDRFHPSWGRRLGFRPEVVSVRRCRSAEDLADLILHSSCTPPLLSRHRRDGWPVYDGGLVDGTPVDLVTDARSTLVLVPWYRPGVRVPQIPGRTYVVPSAPIPVAVWDYTRPDLLQATWDLGRRDGEAFAERALRGTEAELPGEPAGRAGSGAHSGSHAGAHADARAGDPGLAGLAPASTRSTRRHIRPQADGLRSG